MYQLAVSGLGSVNAWCEQTTDGGGWQMVLNYVHGGGPNPGLTARTADFPLQNANALGSDEQGTGYWGHAAPALLNRLSFNETRFYCTTSSHGRVVHFKTTNANVNGYIKTGSGAMSGINSGFTALSGHTAYILAQIDSAFSSQGDAALTEFPFYRSGSYHWGIRGLGSRWECDDYSNGSGPHTIHRVWVR